MSIKQKLWHLERQPIFVVTKMTKKKWGAKSIRRVVKYRTSDGVPVVRFDYHWYLLHTKREFKALVRSKRRSEGHSFIIDGKDAALGYESKAFIKDWDKPEGEYEIYAN